jgi:hypothetical protein
MSMDDLERCPRRYVVVAEFKRARYVGRCHAHFQSHQVIVEVFE